MSAVNIVMDAERAVVFTDGATYEPNGTLVATGRKCWLVKGRRCVVTGRGPAWFAPQFAKTLPDFIESIDDIEEQGEALIDRCIEAAQDAGYLGSQPMIDLFVAGWSEAEGRPKCAQFTTWPPAGEDRFQMVPMVVSPGLSEDQMMAAKTRYPRPAQGVDYDGLGIAIMEEQRLIASAGHDECMPGQFLVGGHILRTDVTAKGITQREIHYWPEDRVGQKIRPSPRLDPAQHSSVTTLPVSRAERRRQEKLQRKGAA